MTYTRINQGVCSHSTSVTLEEGIIQSITVDRGCDGNLKGVCALLVGRDAKEAIQVLQGITCGKRTTSCPDQISLCIQEAIQTP